MSNKRQQRIRYYRLPLLGVIFVTSVAVAQNSAGRKEIVQPLPTSSAPQPVGSSVTPASANTGWDAARASIDRSANSPVIMTVDQWKRLQQSDTLGFDAYAGFLMAHPGWPAEDRMRRLAENSINPDSFSPSGVIAYFERFPARSATGQARYAQALSAAGRQAQARDAARAAWRMGAMTDQDEIRFLGLFSGALSPMEHAVHADAALWSRNTSSAARTLPYLSANDRAITEARIALQRKAPDATAKMQIAEGLATGHAGFIADKASWLRETGNSMLARSTLANRTALTTRPANVEKWYEVLLTNARAAANDRQWTNAFNIARQLDDAYPAGTDVSLQSLGERDDYTSLAWLAGTVALNEIGRARDAMLMFDKYASAARSPQTMTKGYYWAARAAERANDRTEASRHLNMAANYPDQFYGQLAREKMGQNFPAPAPLQARVNISPAERTAFNNRSIVQAVQELGRLGRRADQTLFLRALAANVSTDAERVMAEELAARLSRPDLGVMMGRRARDDGSTTYATSSFPSISVPDGHSGNWTMIHAITRQESQFDRAAVSHAGARGLMQLMPGTARETSGRVGLSYNVNNLTTDTNYNVQLGSTYFRQMLNYYNGSYPLAVAAYNAGPGNVNKWINAYGDPRTGAIDILDWIEKIPFTETKGYVQRVLENAVVYDTIRTQQNGGKMPAAPLSFYLGKRTPG